MPGPSLVAGTVLAPGDHCAVEGTRTLLERECGQLKEPSFLVTVLLKAPETGPFVVDIAFERN